HLLAAHLGVHAADGVGHLPDAGLRDHAADGAGDLLHGRAGHLAADGVGHALADALLDHGGAGHLLADDALTEDLAALHRRRRAAGDGLGDRLALAAAGARVEAAVAAGHLLGELLARHAVLLGAPAADLLLHRLAGRDGPAHGAVDVAVAGLDHV